MNGQTIVGELLIIFGLIEIWYSYSLASNLVAFVSLSVIGTELTLIGAYIIVINLKPEKIQQFLDKLFSRGK